MTAMASDELIVIGNRRPNENEVYVQVGSRDLSGWTAVEVTTGCERVPGGFSVALTSKGPDGVAQLVKAGDECRLFIGNDHVLTGYVDRDIETGDAISHELRIIGRGKCQDLVDCSAEWPGGQISGANALQIAENLAQPYGIDVRLADGADAGPAVPQFSLNYGETAMEIIERVTRAAGLLAYENNLGQLLLANLGTDRAASGAVWGRNVERWQVVNSMDQRYSNYVAVQSNIDLLSDLGDAGFYYGEANDPAVPRHRLMYVIQENVAGDPQEFTKRKVLWEAARRWGRGAQVRVTVDSWRDSAGNLWRPNTLVPVDVPGLRLADKTLILSEVTFRRNGDSGTTAELLLMPKEAFSLQPISLQQVNLAGVI